MTANKYCIGDGDFPKHYARVHIKVRLTKRDGVKIIVDAA
jgi:hypothetical protein